jgi:hypothetical protein
MKDAGKDVTSVFNDAVEKAITGGKSEEQGREKSGTCHKYKDRTP